MILLRLWRWINPSDEVSHETRDTVARNDAVTDMLKQDAEYWRAETAKLEADKAVEAARKALGL